MIAAKHFIFRKKHKAIAFSPVSTDLNTSLESSLKELLNAHFSFDNPNTSYRLSMAAKTPCTML